jgi:membrane protein implicated in regulation of membrane protease activity
MLTALLVIGGIGILMLLISFVAGEALDGMLESVGPDFLSGLAVAGFLAAFGFVGALVLDLTGSNGAALGAGLVAGALVGVGAGKASQVLMRGGDESTVRSSGLVGLTGSVIDAIPADGLGQVSVVAAGHITRLNARADEPLPNGTAVTVTAVLSPTSVRVSRAGGSSRPADA